MFTGVTIQDARPGGKALKTTQLPTGVCLKYARSDRLVDFVFHAIPHKTPFLAYELPHRREIVFGALFLEKPTSGFRRFFNSYESLTSRIGQHTPYINITPYTFR